MGRVIALGVSVFLAVLLVFMALAIMLSPAHAQTIPTWLDSILPVEIIQDAEITQATGKLYLITKNPIPGQENFCTVIDFGKIIQTKYKVAPNGTSATRPLYDLQKYQACIAAGGTITTCPLGKKIGDVPVGTECATPEIRKTDYRAVQNGLSICKPVTVNNFPKSERKPLLTYARTLPLSALSDADKVKCGGTPTPQPNPTPTPTATPTIKLVDVPAIASGFLKAKAIVEGVPLIGNTVYFYLQGNEIHREFGAPYCLGGDNGTLCTGYDTTKIPNGQYVLKAYLEYQGKQGPEVEVSFTVAN